MKYLRILFALFLCNACLFGAQAYAAGKYALVVGVSDYDTLPDLTNATRDAELISNSLDQAGFDVTTLYDPTLDDFNAQEFGADNLDEDSILLIYFAGHGVQVLGENFLLLSDATADQMSLDGFLPLTSILTRLGRTPANTIIVLDSCRNNPLDASGIPSVTFLDHFPQAYASYADSNAQNPDVTSRAVGDGAGMSRVDAQPSNVLLSYATRAGSVSFDGEEDTNSPFAKALSEAILTPDIEVTRMFRQVRDVVVASTGGLQEPFVYGALGGKDVYLNPVDCPCNAEPIPQEFFECQKQAAPASIDYPQGRNVSGINPEAAIPACQAALSKAPDSGPLQFWTGRAYMAAREDEKARDHYLVAAQAGIGGAMHNLALLYDGGRALDFNASRAQYWFGKAEEKGVVMSRAQLAWYLEKGRAGQVDIERAFELYKINAEIGETFSQRKLGFLYRLGLGTEVSPSKSEEWFRKASLDGDNISMYQLGVTLARDDTRMAEGLGWLIMGYANGAEDARQFLLGLADRENSDALRIALVDRLRSGEPTLAYEANSETVLTALKSLTNSAWLAGLRKELAEG